MSENVEQIRADELAIGDKIRIRFQGGEEDIEIASINAISLGEDEPPELISWHGWGDVAGSLSDVVRCDEVLRRVNG